MIQRWTPSHLFALRVGLTFQYSVCVCGERVGPTFLHQSLLKPYPLWGAVYVLSPLRKLYLITHIRTQNYAKWSNISVGWWHVFSSQASWTRLISINKIFTASYFHTFYNFTFIVTREMTQMLKNLTYKHRDLTWLWIINMLVKLVMVVHYL